MTELEMNRTRNPSLRKPSSNMKVPTRRLKTTSWPSWSSGATSPNASNVANAVAPVESTFMTTELVKNAPTVVPAIIE